LSKRKLPGCLVLLSDSLSLDPPFASGRRPRNPMARSASGRRPRNRREGGPLIVQGLILIIVQGLRVQGKRKEGLIKPAKKYRSFKPVSFKPAKRRSIVCLSQYRLSQRRSIVTRMDFLWCQKPMTS
jgi:hypothetical protein